MPKYGTVSALTLLFDTAEEAAKSATHAGAMVVQVIGTTEIPSNIPYTLKPFTTTLKIEAGKHYLDADGRVIGPMISHKSTGFIEKIGDGRKWNPDGSSYESHNVKPLVSLYEPDLRTVAGGS